MPTIQRLPPEIVNRIAAGEVIERPASVVKELVENAIDADATEVLVDLEEGGIKRLTVRDNGSGMEPEDMMLAFESHATSKLRAADFENSLFGIATLGFRGEALPSIASVADVEVVSRTTHVDCAYRIRMRGGKPRGEAEPTAGEPGTVVEVCDLFFNVPARRKFLRTPNSELSRVVEQVTRIALAHPSIRFLVTHGGRRSLDLLAAEDLRQRLLQIVGKEKGADFLAVSQSSEDGEPRLYGYVSSPKLRRGDSRLQHFFVNGRWVRDRMLSAALRSAYQGFLIPGNHPVAYIFLEFDADAVDVNVHPQKSEVRFRDPGRLYPLVFNAVRRALEFQKGQSEPEQPAQGTLPPGSETDDRTRERVRQAALDFLARPEAAPGRPFSRPSSVPSSARPELSYETDPSPAWQERTGRSDLPAEGKEPPAETVAPSHHRAFQVLDSYIVVDDGDGMVLIDQHALHEKILFEEINERLLEGRIVKQKLIVPEIISLPADQVPLIDEACELLSRCGYDVEPFGENDIAIQAVPEIFERPGVSSSSGEIVREVFRWLLEEGGRGSVDEEKPEILRQRLRDVASLMACKRAVKAGAPLSDEEIESLLDRSALASDPRHCPHGRPTIVRLSAKEIERKFDRK